MEYFPEILLREPNTALKKKKLLVINRLVRVKVFPENIPFFGNAIFRKGKRFHVFGCHKIRFTEN